MPDHPSIPTIFKERIRADRPDDHGELLSSLSGQPITSIRLHPNKVTDIKASGRVAWCSNGHYLEERPRFKLDPYWHAGAYYVQEASSMFIEQAFLAMDLPEQPYILDACAAPGGKSTHILSLLNGRGILCSNELIPKRNSILRENLTRWGYANVIATQNNLGQYSRLGERFDAILVDAPCSGEGLFRREMAARRDWSLAHVASCANRQQNLLEDIIPLVRPGGYLVYSTCTFSRSENEDQVQRLMENYHLEEIELPLPPSWKIERGADDTGYRCYPHLIQGEGFYLALLRMPGNLMERTTPSFTEERSGSPDQSLFQLDDLHTIIQTAGNLFIFPRNGLDLLERMKSSLHVTFSGVFAGSLLHEQLKPVHALALSSFTHPECPVVSVDRETAILYLKKEALSLPPESPSGWCLIRYKGVNLGWAKALPNRMNNYYPKSWSIRP